MRSSSVVLSAMVAYSLRWFLRQLRRCGWLVKRWLVRIMIHAGTRRLLFSARSSRSFLARGFLLAMVVCHRGEGGEVGGRSGERADEGGRGHLRVILMSRES